MPKLTVEDIIAQFNKPITINEHGCWLWLGATDDFGYARQGGTLIYGYVWRMAGKESPIGTVLRHQCPNHNCINPDHILLGTQSENMLDAVQVGTRLGPKGRLSQEKIDLVNDLLEGGLHTKTEIVALVGVSNQWMTKFQKGEFAYAKPRKPSE
jgi:hypothetical protein